MTVVKNDVADGFVQRPPPDLRFFLVHGTDEGLIHERARALVRAVVGGAEDPLSVTRIDRDAVAREPGRLADELYAIPMFGGRRAVWIEAPGRDLSSVLEPLLRRPPADCALVVEAGTLPKTSPLRAAFEIGASAASVECYPDDRRSLASLVEAEAAKAGLTITREAREYLVSLLGSDRQTTRGEVVKLMLYAAGAKTIEIADVEAIVTDAAPSGLDDLIDRALLGDLPGVERAAGRFFGDGGDAGLLVMRLVSRALLLHRIRLDMDKGRSFDAALQGHFVPLPAVARAALGRQAERWSSAALAKRLPAIQGVAARTRRDPRLAPALATRALWALARAPGNR